MPYPAHTLSCHSARAGLHALKKPTNIELKVDNLVLRSRTIERHGHFRLRDSYRMRLGITNQSPLELKSDEYLIIRDTKSSTPG